MNSLKIEKRNLERKNSVLREHGYVPGTIYGPTVKSTAIKASSNELKKARDKSGEVYKVMSAKGSIFVKFEEVQEDSVSSDLVHFTLVEIPAGEKNEVDIPLSFSGEAPGVKNGGTLVVMRDEVSLSGKPRSLPDDINVDISNLKIGDKITMDDLEIPKKVDMAEKDDYVVAVCTPPVKIVDKLEDDAKTLT